MESSQEKQDPKAVPPLCEECGYELKGFHDCRASRVMAVEEAHRAKMDFLQRNLAKLEVVRDDLEEVR